MRGDGGIFGKFAINAEQEWWDFFQVLELFESMVERATVPCMKAFEANCFP